MRYHHTPQRRRFQGLRTVISTLFIVAILLAVFVFAVSWFRAPKEETKPELVDDITNVMSLTPSPLVLPREAVIRESKVATLINLRDSSANSQAKRGIKDERYYLEVKTDLPQIDRETQAYEVWLISVYPYDFFSLGQMVTNDEAQFVFEWQSDEGKEYETYTKVLVTLENKDDNPDPGEKVLEGEFKD
ncbi:hypothetical protein ACFLZY_00320 [Patescibacteria group bacterium]